jgi:hypothetical protein
MRTTGGHALSKRHLDIVGGWISSCCLLASPSDSSGRTCLSPGLSRHCNQDRTRRPSGNSPASCRWNWTERDPCSNVRSRNWGSICPTSHRRSGPSHGASRAKRWPEVVISWRRPARWATWGARMEWRTDRSPCGRAPRSISTSSITSAIPSVGLQTSDLLRIDSRRGSGGDGEGSPRNLILRSLTSSTTTYCAGSTSLSPTMPPKSRRFRVINDRPCSSAEAAIKASGVRIDDSRRSRPASSATVRSTGISRSAPSRTEMAASSPSVPAKSSHRVMTEYDNRRAPGCRARAPRR